MNFLEAVKQFKDKGDTSEGTVHYLLGYYEQNAKTLMFKFITAFSTEFDDFNQQLESTDAKFMTLDDILTHDWEVVEFRTKECNCGHFCSRCV